MDDIIISARISASVKAGIDGVKLRRPRLTSSH